MGKPKGKAARKARKLARKKGLVLENDGGGPENGAAGEDQDGSKYSVDQLLDKTEELLDTYEYDLARRFCRRALELEPDHPRALQLTASLLLEAGDAESARHCLGRAVTVQPNEGHAKFLSLAQLLQGREALELYRGGIEIMRKEIQNKQDGPARKELSLELSNAFCACAELFMTDLCDEGDAEENCKASIERAEEADQTNPEAKQTKARFLLIKTQFDEAKAAIQESLSLWLPKYQALLDNKPQEQDGAAGADFDPVEACPLLYTTRIATSKILIELEMWDEATQVLEGLLEEDDQVVETWYLLGWLNRLRATGEDGEDGYNGNARFYLRRAKEAHAAKPTDDEDMIAHIDEVLEEMGPEEEGEEEEEEEGEDKDWEDVETSDEEEQMDQC